MQSGDVLLFQSVDDGEIEVKNGIVTMSSGIETSVYLSLFGGNNDDDLSDNTNLSWWGNILENENDKKYRSRTQYVINGLSLTSSNLLVLEEAVKTDLQWLIDGNIASNVSVSVTSTEINTVKINIVVKAEGLESQFNFVENWRAI